MADSDLPLCMQDGFDPTAPGREYRARVLDAVEEAADQGDDDEVQRLLKLIEED